VAEQPITTKGGDASNGIMLNRKKYNKGSGANVSTSNAKTDTRRSA
jgi:hypothetical protein